MISLLLSYSEFEEEGGRGNEREGQRWKQQLLLLCVSSRPRRASATPPPFVLRAAAAAAASKDATTTTRILCFGLRTHSEAAAAAEDSRQILGYHGRTGGRGAEMAQNYSL